MHLPPAMGWPPSLQHHYLQEHALAPVLHFHEANADQLLLCSLVCTVKGYYDPQGDAVHSHDSLHIRAELQVSALHASRHFSLYNTIDLKTIDLPDKSGGPANTTSRSTGRAGQAVATSRTPWTPTGSLGPQLRARAWQSRGLLPTTGRGGGPG